MLDLANVRCFVAAAEELHFGRAAMRLNMTQPPLSRRIQILEQMLGSKLLERDNRSVALTNAGKRFLPEARLLLKLAEQAERSARRTDVGDEGRLAIGYTAISSYGFIPQIVRELQSTLPNVELRLFERVSSEQIDGVMSGQFDIGFVRMASQHRRCAAGSVTATSCCSRCRKGIGWRRART